MPKAKQTDRRRDLIREGLLLLSIAGLLVLLVALVTHDPRQLGHSLVGVVGNYVATLLYGAFGVVSFVLVILALYTAVIALGRRPVSAPVMRVAGGVMMLVGLCTLLHQFFPEGLLEHAGMDAMSASGGLLGATLFDLCLTPFGRLGTFVFSVVLLCSGFAFATDWLVYEMLFDGARKLATLSGLLRRFWPQPVLVTGAPVLDAPERDAKERETKKAKAPRKSKKKARDQLPEPADTEDPVDAEALVETVVEPPKRTGRKSRKTVAERVPEPEAVAEPAEEVAPAPELVDEELALHDVDVVVPPELLSRLAPPPENDEEPAAESVEPSAEEEVADEAEEEEPAKPLFQVHLEEPEEETPRETTFVRPRGEGDYEFPSPQLLDRPKPRDLRTLEKAIQANAEVLQKTLLEFRVDGEVVDFQQGPVVTMLEIALAPGTKVTKIHSLADDLAMALKCHSVRIVAPIPGKSTVGIEIPNPSRSDVRMLQLLESEAFGKCDHAIPLLLGSAADGSALIDDLAKMPHLLIAGATGSGKSVCVNTILLSILLTRTPDQVKLILVDPKQVELAFFADIPHLLSPVVTDMKRATSVLEWAVIKMEERYDLLRRFEVRNIASYNELGEKAIRTRAEELGCMDEVIPVKLPYIVIIVDELADLMLTVGKDVEKVITRLAQKSRAVGIHIILATQRPSTDVITGLIKANMPTRLAFKVSSKVDARVVLDQNGAEKLLGMGDMLYLPPRSAALMRAQCTYAADREVKAVVRFLKQRYTQEFNEELVQIGSSRMLDDGEKDPIYDEAVRVILHEQRGSASLLQRALGVGYTRASRLLDLMRKEGVVGEYKGSKASDVQMTLEDYEKRVAAAAGKKRD